MGNFLHTGGNCVPLRNRDGATIKVQPTTIAQRSAGITKGSKRLLAKILIVINLMLKVMVHFKYLFVILKFICNF